MALSDIYNQAKKKFQDVNNVMKYMPQAVTETVTHPLRSLAKTPTMNVASRIKNPIGSFAASIPESIVNTPLKLSRNIGQTGLDYNSGKLQTPTGLRQFAGRTMENALDIGGLGLGGKAVKTGQTLLSKPQMITPLIKQGAKIGAKQGAMYGGGYGLSQNLQNDDFSPKKTFRDVVTNTAVGSLAGGVLGGGLPALGALPQAMRNSIRNRQKGQIYKETLPAHWRSSYEHGVQSENDMPIMRGKAPMLTNPLPAGHRMAGKVRSKFNPITQSPEYSIGTEKYIPAQTVERGRQSPTVSELLKGTANAVPRFGNSIEDVTKKYGEEMRPLAEEALRYENFNDFIGKQKKLYHGGAGVDMMKDSIQILSPEEKKQFPSSGGGYFGLSTTDDKNYARQYSLNIGGRDDVAEMRLNPKTKLLSLPSNQSIDDMSYDELVALSKKYDVIKSVDDNEYRILNKTAVLKEKELKDIHNLAKLPPQNTYRGQHQISNENSIDRDVQIAQNNVDTLLKVVQENQTRENLKNWQLAQKKLEELQNKSIAYKEKILDDKRVSYENSFKNNDSTIDRISPSDYTFLSSIAKKTDNINEFIGLVRGSATQYGNYIPKLRSFLKLESKNLGEIGGLNPNAKITIFRGLDVKNIGNKSINKGDFVTTDYNEALSYTDSPHKVVSKQVKVKDLIAEYPEDVDVTDKNNPVAYELIYNPGGKIKKITDSKLKEIYNFTKKQGYQSTQNFAGVAAGVEVDENGNLTINPQKAALGVAGMSVARRGGLKSNPFDKLWDKGGKFMENNFPLTKKAFTSGEKALQNAGQSGQKKRGFDNTFKDVPFEGNPFKESFNSHQQKAYNEKADRIKSISNVLNVPRKTEIAYGKNKINEMSAEEASKREAMLNLGYPKDSIEKIVNTHGQAVIDKQIPYERFPKHLETQKVNKINYSQEEIRNAADQSRYLADEAPNAFRGDFKNWIGGRESAKTKGYEAGIKYRDLPENIGMDVIDAIENPNNAKSKEASFIANELKQEMDALHSDALQNGIDLGYRHNYITHLWKETPEQVEQIMKGAGQKFKFANKRTIDTYQQGIELGLTPKYTHPAQIIGEYVQQLEKTKANINLLKELRNKGIVVDASVAMNNRDFVPLTGPGFPKSISKTYNGETVMGEFYAPKEIADQINRVFGGEIENKVTKFFDKSAKASSTLQDVSLSGGLPGTPINAFAIANGLKELMAGRIVSPIASGVRSMSQNASRDFFEKNISQIKKMQDRNIPISTSLNMNNLLSVRGVFSPEEKGFMNTVKHVWGKAMNEPTFQRFLPQLQINLFNDIEKKALSKGVSEQEASDIAAKALKNFYGLVGTDERALRSKLGSDVLSTFAFAPHYRESMIRFWGKTVQSLKHPLKIENQDNARFFISSLAMLAGYDYLNNHFTGHHLWDNPEGKEDKLLIPGEKVTLGIPYLSSIATVPRALFREGSMIAKGDISGAIKDAGQTYTSSMIKPLADLASNSDYFGNEITSETDTPTEKYKKMGAYALGQYSGHPYIKMAQSAMQGGKSPFQLASQALELPFRFYNNDSLTKSAFWGQWKNVEPYGKKYAELQRTNPEEAQKFLNENMDKIQSYQDMKPLYNTYVQMKKGGVKDAFSGFLDENKKLFMKDTPLPGVSASSADEGNGIQVPEVKKSSTIITTPMGAYSKKLNKSFQSYDDAELAEVKFDFKNSGEVSKEYNGKILTKNSNGRITVTEKPQYDRYLRREKMSQAKQNKDINEWTKQAEIEYADLREQSQKEGLDELTRLKIEGDMKTLQEQFSRVKNQGGFTRARKSRGGATKAQIKKAENYKSLTEGKVVSRLVEKLNTKFANKRPKLRKFAMPTFRATKMTKVSRRYAPKSLT